MNKKKKQKILFTIPTYLNIFFEQYLKLYLNKNKVYE